MATAAIASHRIPFAAVILTGFLFAVATTARADVGVGPDSDGETILAGVGGTPTQTTVLRFFNAGAKPGAATVTLYDGAVGNQLATWTSASIPAGAGLEVTSAQITAAATPVLTSAQQAATLNVGASATFPGTVQVVTQSNAVVANQSACGVNGRVLANVEGPGYLGLTGVVRIVNTGATAGAITLALTDASTGTQLATWTSPSVPVNAAISTTTSAIAAAATPVVAATVNAFNIAPTKSPTSVASRPHFRMEHLASVSGGDASSNLTDTCILGYGGDTN